MTSRAHSRTAAHVAVRLAAHTPVLYAAKATATIDDVADGYRNDLGELVQELLRGSGRLSKAHFRRDMKKMIKDWAKQITQVGWEQGGGDVADMEGDDLNLLSEFTSDQQSHVDDFTDWLKAKDSDLDQVVDRIASWVASMLNLGGQMIARAMGDPRLLFKREEDAPTPKEPCDTCAEHDGETKRLSVWEKLGLIKRNGNDAYDCGHWDGACFHHFYNPKTGEMVIS